MRSRPDTRRSMSGPPKSNCQSSGLRTISSQGGIPGTGASITTSFSVRRIGSAALLGTKPRQHHRRVRRRRSQRCPIGLLVHVGAGSCLRPRPSGTKKRSSGPGPREVKATTRRLNQTQVTSARSESFSPGAVMNVHRHAERFRCLYVSTVIPLGRKRPCFDERGSPQSHHRSRSFLRDFPHDAPRAWEVQDKCHAEPQARPDHVL